METNLASGSGRRRLLLDTSSLAYRAFFGVPSTITDAAGRPVNAVRGYLDMTARLLADRAERGAAPDVVHVFDDEECPAERVAAFPGYKAQRDPVPEELAAQFALLAEVARAAGQPCVRAPGWEADDAIATLCARATDDDRLEVVTGDRDLTQLVRDPVVRVLHTVKGVSEVEVLDEQGVRERYGVPASRYVDFAILRGDPSDGLPGVPGVGDKTARQLVTAYDDLDALLADADSHPPARARRLRDAAGYIATMRAVVPTRTDVALAWEAAEPDPVRLDALAAERNLEGPVRRLREAAAALAGEGA